MREVVFAPDLASDLLALEQAGGVVDFLLIDPGNQNDTPELLHHSAAVFGLQVFDQRLQTYAQAHASSQHPVDQFFRLTWQADQAVGRPINRVELLGPSTNSGVAQGLTSALRHPPYGTLSGAPFDALCHRIVQGALGQHGGDPVSIYAWSSDWSNYFDAGLEWWGAYLWTVQRADGLIAWIGASSTD